MFFEPFLPAVSCFNHATIPEANSIVSSIPLCAVTLGFILAKDHKGLKAQTKGFLYQINLYKPYLCVLTKVLTFWRRFYLWVFDRGFVLSGLKMEFSANAFSASEISQSCWSMCHNGPTIDPQLLPSVLPIYRDDPTRSLHTFLTPHNWPREIWQQT